MQFYPQEVLTGQSLSTQPHLGYALMVFSSVMPSISMTMVCPCEGPPPNAAPPLLLFIFWLFIICCELWFESTGLPRGPLSCGTPVCGCVGIVVGSEEDGPPPGCTFFIIDFLFCRFCTGNSRGDCKLLLVSYFGRFRSGIAAAFELLRSSKSNIFDSDFCV